MKSWCASKWYKWIKIKKGNVAKGGGNNGNDSENILIKAAGDAKKHAQKQIEASKKHTLCNGGEKHNSRK